MSLSDAGSHASSDYGDEDDAHQDYFIPSTRRAEDAVYDTICRFLGDILRDCAVIDLEDHADGIEIHFNERTLVFKTNIRFNEALLKEVAVRFKRVGVNRFTRC